MALLDRVKQLCKGKGITLSGMEKEIEISNGAASKWAKSTPSGEILKKVADYFGVSIDYLLTGKEPELKEFNPQLTAKDERDISKKVDEILSQLSTGDALMFDGEPMDDETKELLRVSLENGVKIAKISAKKKFTPKKYR